MNDILEKITKLLVYNPAEPLIFTAGLFLWLFAAFSFVYIMLQRTTTLRVVYLALFSLFFYYKTSGLFFLLLVFTATSDYAIGHLIEVSKSKKSKQLHLAASIIINLGILCYFKYTNFFIETINNFVDDPLSFQNIFLPIGISFFTFQSMSYTIDIYRGRIKPLNHWIDYVLYVSFFPQLVAGPIVRARDFIPQIRKKPVVTREMFSRGVLLIIFGLFKKAIISDYISMNFVDRVFDAPTLYTGLENFMAIMGYSIQIYCDFSGYSDIAIGLALLLGFHFNINFNSPYKSASITEFWRRWHISLSSWLKDYLYISLGGSRKGKIRTYVNLLITMLLGGLWHGASVRFLLWGAIHGVALAIHKLVLSIFPSMEIEGMKMRRIPRILGITLTFMTVSASWVFFRAHTMDDALDMFYRIGTAFHIEVFWQFIKGYPTVLGLIILGFLLHFSSEKLENKMYSIFDKWPTFVYPIALSLLIFLIMQTRTGEVQPFIYFQF